MKVTKLAQEFYSPVPAYTDECTCSLYPPSAYNVRVYVVEAIELPVGGAVLNFYSNYNRPTVYR